MKHPILIITLISILFLVGCQYSDTPTQVVALSDKVTLAWDPPDDNAKTLILKLNSYEIYYRKPGESSWVFVAEVPADAELKYTLHHEDFGNGMFEFAIRGLTENRRGSLLHTSSDQHAEPFGGWYLFWVNSEPKEEKL